MIAFRAIYWLTLIAKALGAIGPALNVYSGFQCNTRHGFNDRNWRSQQVLHIKLKKEDNKAQMIFAVGKAWFILV